MVYLVVIARGRRGVNAGGSKDGVSQMGTSGASKLSLRRINHDRFHAMVAPDNELQSILLETEGLGGRKVARIWRVVVRIR
jgi:hypothetical protein